MSNYPRMTDEELNAAIERFRFGTNYGLARDIGDELLRLRDDNAKLRECGEDAALALNDWLSTHAPDEAGEDWVKEARNRISRNGGTLAYVTDIRTRLEAALAGEGQEARHE